MPPLTKALEIHIGAERGQEKENDEIVKDFRTHNLLYTHAYLAKIQAQWELLLNVDLDMQHMIQLLMDVVVLQ